MNSSVVTLDRLSAAVSPTGFVASMQLMSRSSSINQHPLCTPRPAGTRLYVPSPHPHLQTHLLHWQNPHLLHYHRSPSSRDLQEVVGRAEEQNLEEISKKPPLIPDPPPPNKPFQLMDGLQPRCVTVRQVGLDGLGLWRCGCGSAGHLVLDRRPGGARGWTPSHGALELNGGNDRADGGRSGRMVGGWM